MVLCPGEKYRSRSLAGLALRTVVSRQRKQATLGRILLPQRRRNGVRVRQISAGLDFDGVRRVAGKRTQTWLPRDALVYVRGEITHPDHRTICLEGWHRVLMNTENRSMAMR